ncbi:MAG: anthranilate synthase component I [Acidobacteria bacterium]|nr:MAG: anthranilate synthase component I [Acidobacteriota bacterium]
MTARTEFADFRKLAAAGGLVAVTETVSADLLTPLSAYLRIAQGSSRSFLLESVQGGEHLARYSFLGAEPAMVVSSRNGVTTVQDADGQREEVGTAVGALRREFANRKLVAGENVAPMAGGCVGYLGYATSSWFDGAMQAIPGTRDDACFLIFRTVLAFDHARQQIQIRTLAEVGADATDAELKEKFDAATEKNSEVVHKLSAAVKLPLKALALTGAGEVEFESNFSREEFERAVSDGKELIFAGECFQIVLSQRFRRKTKANAVALYRALRATNPSPYMFLLNFGTCPDTGRERALIGASPEMLVRCRDRELTYRPIAGTRVRGVNVEEDARLAEELLADQKECAEHMMLVDLGRNDLGRVASYGTVKVDRLMTVEKYSHVQHLVTELHAELRPELDRFDALGACFPAGTVTGAPKIRAMQGIADLERGPREAYAGAVMYADYANNLDSCITIRSIELLGDELSVQAGAGIVADSVPATEWEETVNKSRAMRRAVALAELEG